MLRGPAAGVPKRQPNRLPANQILSRCMPCEWNVGGRCALAIQRWHMPPCQAFVTRMRACPLVASR